MNHSFSITALCLVTFFLAVSCSSSEKQYDASGSFEAIERIISAEATGKIEYFDIEDGKELQAGDTIGQIDVSNLVLQSEQIKASIQAINQRTNDPGPQIDILSAQLKTQESQTISLKEQIAVLDKETKRFQKLVTSKAAPQKQLDDLTGQKSILQKQLEAAQSQFGVLRSQIDAAKRNVGIQNRSILSEITPSQKQLEIIQKQINDGTIINEYDGTVITQYAYDGEFTSIGKPLYKIANLEEIILKVYISGDQLTQVKLNDQVTVLTDDGQGGFKETTGIITWISDKGEFTPKTIQTKDERANMVYALKVKVINDGTYKIGMYGEIKLHKDA